MNENEASRCVNSGAEDRIVRCRQRYVPMPFRKMPFEMPGELAIISGHIGTRDFSRPRWEIVRSSQKVRRVGPSQIQPSLRSKILDIECRNRL